MQSKASRKTKNEKKRKAKQGIFRKQTATSTTKQHNNNMSQGLYIYDVAINV